MDDTSCLQDMSYPPVARGKNMLLLDSFYTQRLIHVWLVVISYNIIYNYIYIIIYIYIHHIYIYTIYLYIHHIYIYICIYGDGSRPIQDCLLHIIYICLGNNHPAIPAMTLGIIRIIRSMAMENRDNSGKSSVNGSCSVAMSPGGTRNHGCVRCVSEVVSRNWPGKIYRNSFCLGL